MVLLSCPPTVVYSLAWAKGCHHFLLASSPSVLLGPRDVIIFYWHHPLQSCLGQGMSSFSFGIIPFSLAWAKGCHHFLLASSPSVLLGPRDVIIFFWHHPLQSCLGQGMSSFSIGIIPLSCLGQGMSSFSIGIIPFSLAWAKGCHHFLLASSPSVLLGPRDVIIFFWHHPLQSCLGQGMSSFSIGIIPLSCLGQGMSSFSIGIIPFSLAWAKGCHHFLLASSPSVLLGPRDVIIFYWHHTLVLLGPRDVIIYFDVWHLQIKSQ
ncbi:hypothetical protein Bpfe_020337 [Biomphalaria pfeifferi]|uniref:Uncharacterized protein n=1 Tax=Biomphalaria pfeifferi TaxID=112525 RepID=A0AAD8B989_BIOPF|nr:hypothetical protein Bpfe_020337 [Biomphalaria pfeifferi]